MPRKSPLPVDPVTTFPRINEVTFILPGKKKTIDHDLAKKPFTEKERDNLITKVLDTWYGAPFTVYGGSKTSGRKVKLPSKRYPRPGDTYLVFRHVDSIASRAVLDFFAGTRSRGTLRVIGRERAKNTTREKVDANLLTERELDYGRITIEDMKSWLYSNNHVVNGYTVPGDVDGENAWLKDARNVGMLKDAMKHEVMEEKDTSKPMKLYPEFVQRQMIVDPWISLGRKIIPTEEIENVYKWSPISKIPEIADLLRRMDPEGSLDILALLTPNGQNIDLDRETVAIIGKMMKSNNPARQTRAEEIARKMMKERETGFFDKVTDMSVMEPLMNVATDAFRKDFARSLYQNLKRGFEEHVNDVFGKKGRDIELGTLPGILDDEKKDVDNNRDISRKGMYDQSDWSKKLAKRNYVESYKTSSFACLVISRLLYGPSTISPFGKETKLDSKIVDPIKERFDVFCGM
jgi:hypothetical protein